MRFLPAALAAFFVLTAAALGQTVDAITPIPVTVPDTVVTIPYGSWFDTALDYIQVAMGGLIMWSLRLLPAQVYALAMTMRADQLLNKAMQYALHSVAGAMEGKVLTVDVRNKVLKEFVTYVLTHGAAAVKNFIGSPEDMAEKGWARLEIPQEGSKPDFATIGKQAMAESVHKEMIA